MVLIGEVAQRVKYANDVKVTVPGLTAELMPFQQKGVSWMYAVKKGILADDVGLGKTYQAIAVAALIKAQGSLGNVLVVCPGGHERHWKTLFSKITPGVFEDVINVSGIQNGKRRTRSQRIDVYSFSPRVMIMNYNILRNDADFLSQFRFGMVILDEATAFKNHETKLFDAILKVTEGAPRILGLTATPFEKALIELHAIAAGLQLDIFGPIDEFKRTYELVEWLEIRRRRGTLKNPHRRTKEHDIRYVPQHLGYRNLDDFKSVIDPIYLRREEKEVQAQLPEVRPMPIWLEQQGEQKKFYESLVRDFKTNRDFGTFTRLIQACDAPYVSTLSSDKTSPKADEMIRILTEDMIDQKAVIFARWHLSIEVISDALTKAGIKYVHFTGKQDEETRSINKQQFIDDPSVQAFVMTTAGEKGIDGLQVAQGLIAFNQLYNPQRMKQVVGRLRRLGSPHKSIVYFNLMMEDSIEEKMWELLMDRANLFDEIFDTTSTTELFDQKKFEAAKREVLKALLEDD